MAAKPKPPELDPLSGSPRALRGRVVCMDGPRTVLNDGIVYVAGGSIVAVSPAPAPAPPDFANVAVTDTGGTLYPGLIELHNHLSYNLLPLWDVPKRFENRDQWAGTVDYRKLVTAPMQVIGKSPELLPALVRYVECKCLVGGVTTSQGIQLFSSAGIRRYYRGVVRNVEQTDQADLPEAQTKIADVEASDAGKFLERLKRTSCMLLHLAEGRDARARSHFLALQLGGEEWAVRQSLAGIHCAALNRDDFRVLGQKNASMIWSPLSNLLLYGGTADIAAAKRAGVRIALGSDWSPTGSKNLLWELKVAKRAARLDGGDGFSDMELVAMATCEPADVLGWPVGVLAAGRRADMLCIDGRDGDPYAHLLAATEKEIALVVINGIARFGMPALMKALAGKGESVRIGGAARRLFLEQADGDALTGKLSLKSATVMLDDLLSNLPARAKKLEKAATRARALGAPFGAADAHTWLLALDEIEETTLALRPKVRDAHGRHVAPTPVPRHAAALAAKPPSELVQPTRLDPLTVIDDKEYLQAMAAQRNLPPGVFP